MKKFNIYMVLGFYALGCGVAPAPGPTGGGATYRQLDTFTSPEGDKDGDGLGDKYEANSPLLGPQCVTKVSCGDDGEEDGDKPEHAKNNTMGFIIAGLAGVVAGAGVEAIAHPVENKWTEWFGENPKDATFTTPNGETMTLKAAPLVGAFSKFAFQRIGATTYLRYYKEAEYDKEIEIQLDGRTFKGNKTLQACYVTTLGFGAIDESQMKAIIQLKTKFSGRSIFAIGNEEFQENCLVAQGGLGEGLYFSFEKYDNTSRVVRKEHPKILGFDSETYFGLYRRPPNAIRFSHLDDQAFLSAAFVSQADTNQTSTDDHLILNDLSNNTMWSALNTTTQKINFLIQNVTSPSPTPIAFETQ
ncbi:MAG: hypothetical protein KDD48_06210 [Bdellovibrionales bacterium]|nr:hypothetical protein [Bdellovibrionales bacterium]